MFKIINCILALFIITSCNASKKTIQPWTDYYSDYSFSEIFSDRKIEEKFDLEIIEIEVKKILKSNLYLSKYNQIIFREDFIDGDSGNNNYTVIFHFNDTYKIFDISFYWADDNRTLLSEINENKSKSINLLELKTSIKNIKARYDSWQLKIRCLLVCGGIETLFTIKENNEYIYMAQIEDCVFKQTPNLNISEDVMNIINMIRNLKTTE